MQATIYLVRGITVKSIAAVFRREWDTSFSIEYSHLHTGMLTFPRSAIQVEGDRAFAEVEMTEREILFESKCESLAQFTERGGWLRECDLGKSEPLNLDGCLVQIITTPEGELSGFEYRRDGATVARRSAVQREIDSWRTNPAPYNPIFGVKVGDHFYAPLTEWNEPPKHPALRRVQSGDLVSSADHNAIVDAIEALQHDSNSRRRSFLLISFGSKEPKK